VARAYIGRYDGQPQKIKEAYDDLYNYPPPFVALDVETISLKNTAILGIGIATPNRDSFWFDFWEPTMPWHLFMPSSVRKIWHNATFDLSWDVLGQFGADIDNIEDTAILTRLLNIPTVLSEASAGLSLSTWSVKELLKKHNARDMMGLPKDVIMLKCMADAQVTMELFQTYRGKVSNEYYEVERKIASMLLHMSHRGIALDQDLVEQIDTELGTQLDIYMDMCIARGFNPRSPYQVAVALTNEGVFLPWDRERQAFDTSSEAIRKCGHPWGALILTARKFGKQYGVIHPMLGKDRLRSHFHMAAATGRITSKDPQVHNIPTGKRPLDIVPKTAPIRRVFKADRGVFTRFDLSQVELRVLAYLSGDKKMQHILSLPKEEGGDLHYNTQMALRLSDKLMAKNFNFGTVYGGDVSVLSTFTGIEDLDLLTMYQHKLAAEYPDMWKWTQQLREVGLRERRATTIYGRELRLDQGKGLKAQSPKHIMNCAVNYPIQGSAAEIFKRILIEINRDIPIEDFIIQVHDEELFDGPHILREKELSHIADFWTPLEVSQISRWQ